MPLPVIDCRAAGVDATLRSLPPGARPVMLGDASTGGGLAVSEIGDLGACFDGDEAWILPVSSGDLLAEDALSIYGRAIAAEPDAGIVYADDDLIDREGRRSVPHFKPDWNPELFEHHDFLTGACAVRVRREDVHALDGQDWAEALIGKALQRRTRVVHLPFVLHHRRSRPQPLIPAKPAAPCPADAPPVTVIVPTRNRAELLRECVEGLSATDYPKFDLIVVDNESDEPEAVRLLGKLQAGGAKILKVDGPFNYSALNNRAVEEARGEVLCFLNNDVEMVDRDWLALLVTHAVRPHIGAVGARLLYPDGTVQHAGVYTGIGGGAAHAHRFQAEGDPGYFERARLPQRVTAVTGACLVVEREKFVAVGGFDEEQFPVAFNDVDLCLKLNARGWQSFYEPRAVLIHHESKSRGSDRDKANRDRFAEELAALKRKWHTDRAPDPFHHPHLSPFCEQFVMGV